MIMGGKTILKRAFTIQRYIRKGCERMKRAVYYKQVYKIVITGRFYEVSDGKALTNFGELRHNPTLQEVWNKTIGLE